MLYWAWPQLKKAHKGRLDRRFKTLCDMEKRFTQRLKNLQKYGFLSVFSKSMDIGDVIYTGYFVDSRGRVYPDSPLHPLHNKALRPLCFPVRGVDLTENQIIDTDLLAKNLANSEFYTNIKKHFT